MEFLQRTSKSPAAAAKAGPAESVDYDLDILDARAIQMQNTPQLHDVDILTGSEAVAADHDAHVSSAVLAAVASNREGQKSRQEQQRADGSKFWHLGGVSVGPFGTS